jgi:superfamily II DNA or RNA helicase
MTISTPARGSAGEGGLPHPGEVVRARDARWRVSRATRYDSAAIIAVVGIDRDNRGVHAGFVLPFEPIEYLRPVGAPRVTRPAVWTRRVREVLAHAVPQADSLRTLAAARITLLPFQLEPALAVVRGRATRLLIADAVGLGKTIQAGLVVAETLARIPDARVLVVAPAGLRPQWRLELAERFNIDATLVDAAAMSTHVWMDANPWAHHGVSIVSVDFVKRPEVLRSLEPLLWDVVVFDEAHALAGRSDRAAAARAIAERSRTVVLLSATPHSGDDDAFARLASVGNLQDRFPLLLFQRTRADLGIAATRRTRWLRIRPTHAEAAMHSALLAYATRVWHEAGPFAPAARLAIGVLLRRACSSASSLARSLERRHAALTDRTPASAGQLRLPWFDDTTTDDEPDAILGAPGLRDAEAERIAIAAVLQLAAVASRKESKLAALERLLRRTREPVIAFTEYRDTLTHLATALASHAPVLLHGGLPAGERAAVLRAFAGGESRLLLATDAASEGLNLQQRCRLVVNVELPWTPTRLEQRIGRVDRIGQRHPVHAVHLIAATTGEEATVARLHERLARVEATLNGRRANPVREDDVAAAVVRGVVPTVIDQRRGPAMAGIVTAGFRDAAEHDARHALMIRGLRSSRGGDREAVSPRRPVLTRIRRRRPYRGVPGCYWAVHVPFTTPDDEELWSALLCLHDSRWRANEPVPPLRQRLDRRWIDSVANVAQVHLLEQVRDAVGRWRALAEQRELAIASALIERRARLAATLVQGGLFDRRAERLAAAQAALLEAAVRRSEERLTRLRRHTVSAAPMQLAFAVLVD